MNPDIIELLIRFCILIVTVSAGVTCGMWIAYKIIKLTKG